MPTTPPPPTHRTELTQCTGCACFNLRKAARVVTQVYDQMLRPAGIRTTQFSLLVAISMLGSPTVSRLAEVSVMDRTTLTRNLEVLKKQGLVDISRGNDRRTRIVNVTRAGRNALEEALPLWEQAQSRVVKALGESRWQSLRDHLSAIVAISAPG